MLLQSFRRLWPPFLFGLLLLATSCSSNQDSESESKAHDASAALPAIRNYQLSSAEGEDARKYDMSITLLMVDSLIVFEYENFADTCQLIQLDDSLIFESPVRMDTFVWTSNYSGSTWILKPEKEAELTFEMK